MATWGEFLKDFKITNMKGTVYVHADQVLDVWEERNKLREEVGQLREQMSQAREVCARDIEELAEASASDPDQPEHVAVILRAGADWIRQRGQVPEAEEVQSDDLAAAEAILAAPVTPPAAEPVSPEEVTGDIPTADPVLPAEEIPRD